MKVEPRGRLWFPSFAPQPYGDSQVSTGSVNLSPNIGSKEERENERLYRRLEPHPLRQA